MLNLKTLKNAYNNILQLSDFESGDGYIRFPDGTLICCGYAYAESNVVGAIFPYAYPFIEQPSVIATHNWSEVSQGKVTIGQRYLDRVVILIYDFNDDISRNRHCQVVAIGRWK